MSDIAARNEFHDPFVSYSINCEDVLLRRLFADKLDGFFVDVGAEHPRLGNDFHGFYLLGWTGINIEPSSEFFPLLEANRPRDLNLQVALSDRTGLDIAFFEVNGTGLSTCDSHQAEVYAANGYTVVRHELRTTTLAEILNTAKPSQIDILKVDVEGLEEEVLLGNDWKVHRPAVIMVEATYPNTPVRRPTNIRSNLEAVGYRHIHFDGLNDFYAENAFVVPDGATLPPNVFDNFVRWDTVAINDDNASMRIYAKSLETDLADVRIQNHNAINALRRSEATSAFTRAIAVASTLNKPGHARRMLFTDAGLPIRESSEGQTQMPEQIPQENSELVPIDIRLELMSAQLHALDAENCRLSNEIKDLSNENRRLLSSTSHLQGENLALRQTLGPAQSLNEELTLILGRIETDLHSVNREIGTPFRSNLAAQLDELRHMQTQGSEASKLLAAIYQSTSWRLTKPIRALASLFKS